MQMGDLLLTFRTHDLQQAEVGVCWIVEGGEEEGGFFFAKSRAHEQKARINFYDCKPR